ncbi:SusC/RagA family TonB-linked outer membrane protein [Polluticaenibacter yanchengensis]|uniref:SusC/RagA family TonB-linked outer membrane protein n=1 Tax=Polluticaenibacter yanchengensis TaxID=3014562 RepID=A0ABT4UNM7_9BACT|nr:SusC/RagA family TonB-linked outer membrane protein [Chitinophagaceae bacterium LY-5]
MKIKNKILLYMLPMLLLAVNSLIAQTVSSVTGKVTDAKNGNPIEGVSVTVKGTTTGTSTDVSGNYNIKISSNNAVLVFSFVGYSDQEVPANKPSIDIKLSSSEVTGLNDVVVIGYGTQRKKDVTGSIAKVTGEQITTIAAPSFEASLQGKAPGVQVTQGSGLAGSGSVIRIRGIGSISAAGDPLYVIDGIPIYQDNFQQGNSGGMNLNPLAAINPNDIESIEILKDAGATGIYGSRGANGVILVTTKRGKVGKLSVNYNNKLGAVTYANRPDFLSNREYLAIRQEAYTNDGHSGYPDLNGGISWSKAMNTNTNWWALLTRVGMINEHSLGVNFGNKLVRSYIGAVYSDNESYLQNNSYTRAGLRANLDFNFSPKFKVLLNGAYNRGINKRVPAAWAGGLGDAMSTALPYYPVYNDDGTYFTGGSNPVRRLNETKWRNYDDRVLAGLTLEYKPIKNFTIRAQGSLDYFNTMDYQYESAEWLQRTDVPGIAKANPYWGTNWQANVTAQYDFNVTENSRMSVMVGTEAQESVVKGYNSDIYAYTDKQFYENKSLYKDSLAWFKTQPPNKSNFKEIEKDNWTFNSIFARINYNIASKYIFQLQARYDGSSKFGPNNKHGFFPSASAAWVISEEKFLKNSDLINLLKFRASYGIVGNANIPSGEYYYKYYTGSTNYQGEPTLYPSNIGNPDLKWETLKNFDLALEFGLFKNRITGEVAYYNKNTIDQLLNAGIQPNTGFGTMWRNLNGGKILNEGVELSLNLKVIDKKDFSWTVGGNISKNYNEVKSIGDLDADALGGGTNDTRIIVGYPVGTNFVSRYYGVDPVDGLPIWYDAQGKLTKTFSLDNRVPVGKVIPDYVGGVNTALRYKQFELSALFTYVIGGNLYDGSAKRQAGIITDWNIRRDLLDRWQNPGDDAKFPRTTLQTGTYPGLSSEWQYNSTMFLYDASFMRLRELTLRYNIPSGCLKRVGLRNASIFVTGMNLLTFTKYIGGDPEIARDFENAQDRNMSPNVTYLTPPQQKSVMGGINITF